jgi:hypothetical protein
MVEATAGKWERLTVALWAILRVVDWGLYWAGGMDPK